MMILHSTLMPDDFARLLKDRVFEESALSVADAINRKIESVIGPRFARPDESWPDAGWMTLSLTQASERWAERIGINPADERIGMVLTFLYAAGGEEIKRESIIKLTLTRHHDGWNLDLIVPTRPSNLRRFGQYRIDLVQRFLTQSQVDLMRDHQCAQA